MTSDDSLRLVGQLPMGPASTISGGESDLSFNSGPYLVSMDISDPETPREQGRLLFSDNIYTLEVDDGLAYLTLFDQLVIVDAADPGQLQMITTMPVEAESKGLAIANDLLLMASAHTGLTIYDIHDPAQPTRRGQFPIELTTDNTPSTAASIAVRDPLAALGRRFDTHLLDITNPDLPREIAFLPDVRGEAVSLHNDHLLAAGLELRIFDIANPATPIEVSRIPLEGLAQDIRVRGNHAYIAAGSAGLHIIDISNPQSPSLASIASVPGIASSLSLSEELARVAAQAGGVRIINTASPTEPTEVGAFETGDGIEDVAVRDAFVYLAARRAGLVIVDSSDPTMPTRTASYRTGRIAESVSLHHDVAVVVDRGLHLVDISTPQRPEEVGFIDTDQRSVDVAVAENIAYVSGNGGLYLYDIAFPEAPQLISSLLWCNPKAPCARAIAVHEQLAYVVDGDQRGVHVFSVENPHAPTEISYLGIDERPVDISVTDHAAVYVTATTLYVLDTVEPSHLKIAATLDFSSSTIRDVQVHGTDVYVSFSAEDGIALIDISNLEAPILRERFAAAGPTKRIAVSEDLLFTASESEGLVIFEYAPDDVATERHGLANKDLRLLGTYPNPFRHSTEIHFELASTRHVTLTVYDLLGRRVETIINQPYGPGHHSVKWVPATRASGVYFLGLRAGDQTARGSIVIH